MNTKLLRYSRFQLPDFLMQRLSVPVIMLGFVAFFPTYMMTKNTTPGFMQSAQGISLARQMFSQSITLYLPIGAFVAGVGVISADRHLGYFRFLFSKPVSVVAYYAQTYMLQGLAFIAGFGVMVAIFSSYTIHFSIHRSMEAAALTFVLIGGLGLLFGAITRLDGVLLIVSYVLALVLQQLLYASNALRNGGLSDWLARIAKVLPPAYHLDRLRDQLYAGAALDMPQLWHVLGYGSAAAIAGLILLRRLPLAR